ncbi:hypothetical protein [Mycobacterium camsae]|uniref:hypothetical protein n=1 Tax=Mycobacterium gordonae TaxID=1778 RepID=UPI001F121D6C|nr:hypothetical protein [Mycobacterium gordonae]
MTVRSHVHPLRRIAGSETVRSETLSAGRRAELLDRMYDVYTQTMHGHTREQFEQHLFGAGDLRLTLYRGASGEFAGFAYIGIQCVEHAGRPVAAFSAGGFFRPGYHDGGVSGMAFGLREALRFKLRRPGTALGYLARTSSPVAYRLFTRTMPRVYPSRGRPIPPDIDALVRKLAAGRGYRPIGADPWIVRSDAVPRNAAGMNRFESHPDVRFYRELNPHHDEALLVWIPLTAVTMLGGLCRQVRLRLSR